MNDLSSIKGLGPKTLECLSNININNTPAITPITAGITSETLIKDEYVKLGINNEKNDAASITPPAKPKNKLENNLFSFLLLIYIVNPPIEVIKKVNKTPNITRPYLSISV